ncbi:type VII secretion protein EssC [Leifsonia sp. 2TAF2]|uniref:type VII secretion protein EssC n=1 Tax=Leifsonia sp. 2TAF2 TaxID=3233009 RepID=UPI003F960834
MDSAFGLASTAQESPRLVDDRLAPAALLFTVYVLAERLTTLPLTEDHRSAVYEDLTLGVVNDTLFVNGSALAQGRQEFDGRSLFVVDARRAQTKHMLFDADQHFVLGSSPVAGVRTKGDSMVLVHGDGLTLNPGGGFLYLNDKRITELGLIDGLQTGDRVLTPEYLLEKRASQWRVTTFAEDVVFDYSTFLEQEKTAEFPPDFPEYRRSPRITLEVPTDTIKVEKIGAPEKPDKNSILKALLPPLGMVAVGAATTILSGRNPLMMLGMALMSVVTAAFTLSQFVGDRRGRRAQDATRHDEYERYLLSVAATLARLSEKELQVREYALPAPAVLAAMVRRYDSRIYERMPNNKDFLEVSLGTGDTPSSLTITSDISERDDDEDARRVTDLIARFATQRQAPVRLNVRAQTLGLVGSYDVVGPAAANLLFQVAAFHSYRDVEFIALVPEKSYRDDWYPWRFLPHFTMQGLNVRGLVHNAKTRDMILTSFTQILTKRRQALSGAGREKTVFAPHYIFTVFDDAYLAGHGINEFLAEDMSDLGVTVVWCKEDRKLLPETVTALIEYANRNAATVVNDDRVHVARDFTPSAAPAGLEQALRRLSNLQHVEVEKNAIPSAVTFLEMYDVKAVEELEIGQRWDAADTSKTLAVPLGLRGKDDLVDLNLHERAHGPHGLVAGTTGSGKSEIVQSYILSLAVNFAPEDVGFLPIDFKGGGMANLFTGLPHLLGSITNLDGAASARALASIRAELQKRQRLFGQFDVNHINGYTRLYKLGKDIAEPAEKAKYPSKPMPHLFLISDEFAELKANQPEFMEELVSTARIGRSLGVHLILATQKPSGVVNDQIWSNSRFKLALKVADVSDSNEIIKTPDAASIVEPGRAYLQVGNNEIYELFQSAWSGADYDPTKTEKHTVDERIYLINDFGQYDLWTQDLSGDEAAQEIRKEKVSELDAVVDHIAAIAQNVGAVLPDKPWLPPLESRIVTPAVGSDSGIPLGLMDIPSRQAQESYHFTIEDASHTVVFGSPGFGASTLLQTIVLNLARKSTPEQVQFHLLDLGNNGLLPVAGLPHVADIVTLEEEEKFRKMLERIAAVLAERKSLLRAAGVASLSQYSAKTGAELPLIVNVLDGYDALAQDKRRDEIDGRLIQLLREGAALGVYLVMTANRANSIRMNMSSNIPTKFALYLNDEADLTAVFGRERVMQAEILGRGQLRLDAPTAVQFYLPAPGETDTEILANVEAEVKRIDASWTGGRPARIPMVPEKLTLEGFAGYVCGDATRNTLFLGANKSRAIPERFELFRGKALAIFPATGKQAAAMYPFLMSSLLDAVAREDLVVIDAHDTLKPFLGSASLYIGKTTLKGHVEAVKRALARLVEGGTQTRRCIVINGMTDVFEKLMLPNDQVAELLGVGGENVQMIVLDQVSKVNGNFGLAGTMKENLDQILFGGDLGTQRFVDNLPLGVKKQPPGKNVLHSLKDDELSEIVIPTVDESEEER